MGQETGIVRVDKFATTKNQFGKYSLCVTVNGEEKWFSTNKGPVDGVTRGDKISFDSGDSGKLLMKVKVMGKDSGGGSSSSPSASPKSFGSTHHGDFVFPIPATGNYQRAVQRANAIAAAVALVAGSGIKKVDDAVISIVLSTAKEFETYMTGDDAPKAKPEKLAKKAKPPVQEEEEEFEEEDEGEEEEIDD